MACFCMGVSNVFVTSKRFELFCLSSADYFFTNFVVCVFSLKNTTNPLALSARKSLPNCVGKRKRVRIDAI